MADEQNPPQRPRPVARYDWEPSYVGIQSFLKLPVCLSPEALAAAGVDIAIGGTPWDGTNTARSGTHLGPQSIRRCDNAWSPPLSRPSQAVRLDPFKYLSMVDYGDAEVVPGNTLMTFANVRRFVGEILAADAIPIMLGGDHAVSLPHILAVADHYGFGSVGVVQFDAHSDTAPVPPGHIGNHGTQMRELIEAGAVRGHNFVQVGMRGGWPDPEVTAWMESEGMRTHYMAEVDARGFDAVLEDAIAEAADGAEHIFLTVDVDAADPAFAPGTGSPEPGGMTSGQLLRAVRRIAHEVGIVGMDVVEVSPPYDVGNSITAMLAHRCVLEAITGIAMRRAGIEQSNYLDVRAAGGPGAEVSPHGGSDQEQSS